MYKHEKDNESAEMYLETILLLKKEKSIVKSIDVSEKMNFSRASVSRAVSLLRDKNLITIDNVDGNIVFTKEGEEYANRVFHRHCILNDFFISLGISKETAEEDACKVEHILSNESFEAIENYVKNLEK